MIVTRQIDPLCVLPQATSATVPIGGHALAPVVTGYVSW
jgi:hypothetical protein